jgi:hypothetical protein
MNKKKKITRDQFVEFIHAEIYPPGAKFKGTRRQELVRAVKKYAFITGQKYDCPSHFEGPPLEKTHLPKYVVGKKNHISVNESSGFRFSIIRYINNHGGQTIIYGPTHPDKIHAYCEGAIRAILGDI